MNRGDTRLVLTILSTAIASATMTVVIERLMESSNDAHVQALEHRVSAIEARAEAPVPPVTVEPVIVEAPAEAQPDICDEVSCVLNNYEPTCCAQFDKGHHSNPGIPDSIDRAIITQGIASVKARIMACGDRSSAKGRVKVSVKVAPDGSVMSVTVKETPDVPLANCVAETIQRAKFAKTAAGGSFGYPFVF
jgi:hypothetical protein